MSDEDTPSDRPGNSPLGNTPPDDTPSKRETSPPPRTGPPIDLTMHPPADGPGERSGQKIGPCTLRRMIGRGGMGAVYEAIQENPRRTVAVKLMRRGITSKTALRRFEFESQILARLRHPGIAQVYEAGTHEEDGEETPFFVMEYIPGALSITDYAHKHQLSVRDRMKLFLQVCDAVQHGHLKGIVHRDLKPGNILIASSGKPKIIDFGVARSTDSDLALTTQQTDIGQILGTVQYMSPEQCEADPNDIDTRSDVYALGVVLHELLTSQLPYDLSTAQLHEAIRIVREQAPPRLSSIDRRLKGDLEVITGKALEKERRRRYQTASALSEDIGHWLDDEPITAKPPGAMDTLVRFARRHTAAAVAIAAIFFVLVIAIAVITTVAIDANAQREAAQAAQAQEQDQRQQAEAAKDFLKTMIASIDPAKAGTMDTSLMIHTLDQAASRIQSEFEGQPLLEAELRLTVGATYVSLGLYREASEQIRRALQLRTDTLGGDHIATLRALGRHGRVLRQLGAYDEAREAIEAQLAGLQAMLSDEDPATLLAKHALAMTLIDTARFDEAAPLIESVIDAHDRRSEPTADAVGAYVTMGELKDRTGDPATSERMYARAIELIDQLPDPDPIQRQGVRYKLAVSMARQARPDEAISLLREVLAEQEAYLGPAHPRTLVTAGTLGGVLANTGDLESAEPLFKKVYEGQLRSLGPEHANTLYTMSNLGNMQLAQGHLDAAAATLEPAMSIALRARGVDHPQTHRMQLAVARLRLAQGRPEEGLAPARANLKGCLKVYGEFGGHTLQALDVLAQIQEAAGALDDAAATRQRMADIETRASRSGE